MRKFRSVLVLLVFTATQSFAETDWSNKPKYGDITDTEINEIEKKRDNWPPSWLHQNHLPMCYAWGFAPNVCKLDLKLRCRESEKFKKLCKEKGVTPMKRSIRRKPKYD